MLSKVKKTRESQMNNEFKNLMGAPILVKLNGGHSDTGVIFHEDNRFVHFVSARATGAKFVNLIAKDYITFMRPYRNEEQYNQECDGCLSYSDIIKKYSECLAEQYKRCFDDKR